MYAIVKPEEPHHYFRHSLSLDALEELLPDKHIDLICKQLGHKWRRRHLPPALTVRSMIRRGLNSDRSIAATVADLVASGAVNTDSLSDSAWCQARSRLPQQLWGELLGLTARRLRRSFGRKHLWFGRPVFIADGSTVSMPDEPSLVDTFGYTNTKHGPSRFPVAQITFITVAGVQAVWDYRLDDYRTDERAQFHAMWHKLPSGCICLLDRKFCSFYNLAKLRQRSIGVLSPLHQRRDPNKLIRNGRAIGNDEWAVPLDLWPQTRKQYDDPSLPNRLWVRLIRVRYCRGQKRCCLWLVSTLMDEVRYPCNELVDLYRKRWGIETRIGSLKTTLEMSVLRSKSPGNIRSEIAATIIAHNLVWTLIHQAAEKTDTSVSRISFSGAIKTVLAFSTMLRLTATSKRCQLYAQMLRHIARNTNHHPFNRVEPRLVKRERRRYAFLQTTRAKARKKCLT